MNFKLFIKSNIDLYYQRNYVLISEVFWFLKDACDRRMIEYLLYELNDPWLIVKNREDNYEDGG